MLRLPRLAVVWALDHVPVGHDRFARGLAVNGPGRAVVVRAAVLRPLVAVREDREAELLVLVQHLPFRGVFRDILGDEIRLAQHLADKLTDAGAALRPRM